jgi:hypothetical protein
MPKTLVVIPFEAVTGKNEFYTGILRALLRY